VLHVITRSPFESRGGVASFTAGGRSVRQATVRYAGVIHPRVAMSLSADYFQGEDWPTEDPTETKKRDDALAAGADPDTLRIGLRDPFIRRAGGEVRLDWRPDAQTEVITKSGVADAINIIEPTATGATQLHDWRSWYVQSKVQRGHLVANLVFNANDAGDTYFLRTGLPLVEKSRLASAQLQHGAQRAGVDLVYGMDVRATDPRTAGTVHGQYEDDDFLVEAGAYGQATTALGDRLQMVTALRADHHSILQDLVLEPRVGIVYKPGRTHAVRLTYNHAYSSPAPVDLFRDMQTDALRGLPYALRAEARPRTGFTFRRDCNGLCMRSPFAGDKADQYMPADATLLWAEITALLRERGVNIADIPAPSSTGVSSVLATLNPMTRTFDPVMPADVRDVEPVRRQLTDVLELGYEGVLHGGAAISVDLYSTHVRHGSASQIAITPNVFFDKASLQRYLAQFRTSAAAAQLATLLAQIPVGTVTPTQSPYSADILFVRRQEQSYTIYGVDLVGELPLGATASAFATYSWASYDSSRTLPDVPVNLTIPENKASLMVSYGRPAAPLQSSLRARAVGPFRGATGQTVAGYGVIDVSLTARLPGTRASVAAEAQNLLDHRHPEFPGGAVLGRIVLLRTRLEF
jgi:outer membrane receptor for ferrienterochelin and colicins